MKRVLLISVAIIAVVATAIARAFMLIRYVKCT